MDSEAKSASKPKFPAKPNSGSSAASPQKPKVNDGGHHSATQFSQTVVDDSGKVTVSIQVSAEGDYVADPGAVAQSCKWLLNAMQNGGKNSEVNPRDK
jgi:hypothetical protein